MVEEASGGAQGDGPRDGPEDGEWLTIAAAARRLRVSPRAIRGRIERGTIRWKIAGNTGRMVFVPVGKPTADDAGDHPEDDPRAEIDRLREELLEARIAQARAEERAAALRELVDELRAELAELRKPWWKRWRG